MALVQIDPRRYVTPQAVNKSQNVTPRISIQTPSNSTSAFENMARRSDRVPFIPTEKCRSLYNVIVALDERSNRRSCNDRCSDRVRRVATDDVMTAR